MANLLKGLGNLGSSVINSYRGLSRKGKITAVATGIAFLGVAGAGGYYVGIPVAKGAYHAVGNAYYKSVNERYHTLLGHDEKGLPETKTAGAAKSTGLEGKLAKPTPEELRAIGIKVPEKASEKVEEKISFIDVERPLASYFNTSVEGNQLNIVKDSKEVFGAIDVKPGLYTFGSAREGSSLTAISVDSLECPIKSCTDPAKEGEWANVAYNKNVESGKAKLRINLGIYKVETTITKGNEAVREKVIVNVTNSPAASIPAQPASTQDGVQPNKPKVTIVRKPGKKKTEPAYDNLFRQGLFVEGRL